MSSKKRENEVWRRLFPPKVGDKVIVARITLPSRLKDFPIIQEFLGKRGTIVAIEEAWLNKEGWWSNRNGDGVLEPAYTVQFAGERTWVFMERDLERIEGDLSKKEGVERSETSNL